MDIGEYERRVIEHFKSGHATELEWTQLGKAVNHASEMCSPDVREIDCAVFGRCEVCGQPAYGDGNACDHAPIY